MRVIFANAGDLENRTKKIKKSKTLVYFAVYYRPILKLLYYVGKQETRSYCDILQWGTGNT